MKKYFLSTIYILTSIALVSCGKSEINDLQDAQLCLNSAGPSQAMGCLSKISSYTSQNAYKLRCSAYFISDGFTSPSSFVDAFDQLKGGSGSCTGGCSSAITAMQTFKFDSESTGTANNEKAAAAFGECSKSGVNLYTQIASLFNIGTMATTATLTANPTVDQIKTAIGTLPSSDLGSIVSTTYESSCQNTQNASQSTQDYCNQLQVAISASGGSNTAIGDCLKAVMNNPALTTCP